MFLGLLDYWLKENAQKNGKKTKAKASSKERNLR